MNEQNGWNEWSKHVLKELERLNNNYESIQENVREINAKISTFNTEVNLVKKEVDDLYIWKSKVDEIVSPTQLSNLVKEVDRLKTFKTQAITIFLVVNFLWGVGVSIAKFVF